MTASIRETESRQREREKGKCKEAEKWSTIALTFNSLGLQRDAN